MVPGGYRGYSAGFFLIRKSQHLIESSPYLETLDGLKILQFEEISPFSVTQMNRFRKGRVG